MDGATLAPYPHYSWFAHWLAIRPPRIFAYAEDRHVTHRLLLTTAGDADIAWTAGGREEVFHSTAGDIGFYPCDHAMHALAITAASGYRAYTILLPERHLRPATAPAGTGDAGPLRPVPVFRDALMHASLLRLAEAGGVRQISEDVGDDIAARQIVMRLCGIAGCPAPEWQQDRRVFSPPVMRQIVARVDAHLVAPLPVEQVSLGFGLSPSHFARKFQKSTGVSLNRFINRRRVGLALSVLARERAPLAQLSLDLGFCSQSHFTRLFSGLTGLTPHQFSLAHRRMEE